VPPNRALPPVHCANARTHGVQQQWGPSAHLVDTGVDELLPSLKELLYCGQVPIIGSCQEQARSFLLRPWHPYEVSQRVAARAQEDAPNAKLLHPRTICSHCVVLNPRSKNEPTAASRYQQPQQTNSSNRVRITGAVCAGGCAVGDTCSCQHPCPSGIATMLQVVYVAERVVDAGDGTRGVRNSSVEVCCRDAEMWQLQGGDGVAVRTCGCTENGKVLPRSYHSVAIRRMGHVHVGQAQGPSPGPAELRLPGPNSLPLH
jgi:hypothetical protein